MAFFIKFADDAPNLFRSKVEGLRNRMELAFAATVHDTAEQIKARGDADITSGGNFGSRWTKAFTVDLTPSEGYSDKYVIEVYFDGISYAHVFEFGATIKAKGTLFSGEALLWIPLSFANVPQSGGGIGKMTAQEYGASVNKLFRVDRKSGAPLLLDIKTREPKYFGTPSVTLKPRFHIREICAELMAGFQDRLVGYLGVAS